MEPRPRVESSGALNDVYVKSQEHLLRPTSENPLPTSVPPPSAGMAGLIGVRHVLIVIGLPERGKCFIAQRLSKYLYFFHGAEVKLFDVAEYMGCQPVDIGHAAQPQDECRIEASANTLTRDLKLFLNSSGEAARRAGGNMTVPVPRNCQTAQARAAERAMAAAREEIQNTEQHLLVDEADRRRKNVDSGKVAIIFTSDGMGSFYEKWACTSKERRRWAAETIQSDKRLGAKVIFIEVIVNSAKLMEQNLLSKIRHERRLSRGAEARESRDSRQSREGEENARGIAVPSSPATPGRPTRASSSRNHGYGSGYDWSAAAAEALEESDDIPPRLVREFHARVNRFARVYVSLQEDGSEDDLSYIKLINYGDKVVTNNMHGYLRMRIAQFLTVVHPTPHVIYLTRHGQSTYNQLGKIGGNSPLSPAGEEYARRLGAWVMPYVCYQQAAGLDSLTKTRLWTSSLQRTILTAQHIPHPIISEEDLGTPSVPPEPDADDALANGDSPTRCSAGRSSGLRGTPPRASGLRERLRSGGLSGVVGGVALGGIDLDSDRGGGGDRDRVWQQMAPRVYRNLDEIFAGEYEGMTYEEIKKIAPSEATLRSMDKIGYRYPRGESYFDILARLDPLVHELESYHEPLVIVSHQAVLRLLYCYLTGRTRAQAPKLSMPLHTVIRITYDGWTPPTEERFYLGPECSQTDGQTHL